MTEDFNNIYEEKLTHKGLNYSITLEWTEHSKKEKKCLGVVFNLVFDDRKLLTVQYSSYDFYEIVKSFRDACERKISEIAAGKTEFEKMVFSYGFRKI